MARKGLGKGLDSLIPDFYNEDFDSNSTPSLEDMLKEKEEPAENEEVPQEETPQEVEEISDNDNIFDQVEKETKEEELAEQEDEDEEEVSQDESEEEVSQDEPEEETESEVPELTDTQIRHISEVKEIVDKNPRITLWSSRSSAVFRYLRKTEPEFSISKEASILIEEAVSKKYPEIWALFEDY